MTAPEFLGIKDYVDRNARHSQDQDMTGRGIQSQAALDTFTQNRLGMTITFGAAWNPNQASGSAASDLAPVLSPVRMS